jgi:hypothetical protein
MIGTDPVIINTIIAIVVSGIGSYVSYFFSTKKAEQDARRDYQYDARKRLYQEYEPLIFQLHELCENAYNRIANLAENLRDGRLKMNSGWLDNPSDQTYFANTIYRLLAPLAVFKLMERALTTVDLELEKHVKNEYYFAKALYHVFRRDHWFANPNRDSIAPQVYSKIDYDPHDESISEFERKKNPEKYREQVIHLGQIDKMSEALLKNESQNESPNILRLMSFGEFCGVYLDNQIKNDWSNDEDRPFCEISKLFLNFHPATSPVVWRILTAHAYICRMISEITREEKEKELKTILEKNSSNNFREDYKQFYWYHEELKQIKGNLYLETIGNVEEKMADITQENFKIAETYLKDALIGHYGKY